MTAPPLLFVFYNQTENSFILAFFRDKIKPTTNYELIRIYEWENIFYT